MADEEYRVLADDHDGVRLLTLDRPEKLNAFTPAGYRSLRSRLLDAADDPAVAVCVITGNGRAFSAGVDLDVMGREGGSRELGEYFDPLLETLATFPLPLIAAVNGVAVGFGATLLLHCDLVLVDEAATVRLPFVALGTCAEAASSWLLPTRIGLQRASWVVLSGAKLSAAEAVSNGIALATTPTGAVVDEALAGAGQLAAHSRAVLAANKALLREGWAEQILTTWEREKAAMAAVAEEMGPIGWGKGTA